MSQESRLDSQSTEAAWVQVVSGVCSLPLAGMTVAAARREAARRLAISPDALPLVGGRQVDPAMALAAGQVLTFVRHVGQMG